MQYITPDLTHQVSAFKKLKSLPKKRIGMLESGEAAFEHPKPLLIKAVGVLSGGVDNLSFNVMLPALCYEKT
jgi:hypothetical protein